MAVHTRKVKRHAKNLACKLRKHGLKATVYQVKDGKHWHVSSTR